jgi:Rieske Fe-S protein
MDQEISRRTFLAWSTVTLGGAVTLGVGVPVVAGLVPTEELTQGGRSWSPLSPEEVRSLVSGTKTPVKIFFKRQKLDAYLGTLEEDDYAWGIRISPSEERDFRADRSDLFAQPTGLVPYPVVNLGFVLFSPVCPHLGVRYAWDEDAGRFICPGHGSQYDRFGKHLAGPAPRGLDPLPVHDERGVAEVQWVTFKSGEPDRLIVSYA